MNVSGLFELEKAAKSKGGDKYRGVLSNSCHDDPTTIYICQVVSRVSDNKPAPHIYVRVTAEDETSGTPENLEVADFSVQCDLTKAAKSRGSDRYDGSIQHENISVYIAQCFTRIASFSSSTSSKVDPIRSILVTFALVEERTSGALNSSRSFLSPSLSGKRVRAMDSVTESITSENPNKSVRKTVVIEFEEEVEGTNSSLSEVIQIID